MTSYRTAIDLNVNDSSMYVFHFLQIFLDLRKCNQNVLTPSKKTGFSLVMYARLVQSSSTLKPCHFLIFSCKLAFRSALSYIFFFYFSNPLHLGVCHNMEELICHYFHF